MCHRKAQNVPQHGTKRLLDLLCHGEGTKCATARHKKTFRLMCHGKAQNEPRDGTKCPTAWHKKTYVTYVPWEGTKCYTARHKKTFRLNWLKDRTTRTTTRTTTTKQSLEPVELRSRLKRSGNTVTCFFRSWVLE
jgi:hypothetical protein